MATINAEDYPREFEIIRYITNIYYVHKTFPKDKMDYYKALASLYKKALSTTVDQSKKALYKLKGKNAEKEARLLEKIVKNAPKKTII